jgi:hypothetical protein
MVEAALHVSRQGENDQPRRVPGCLVVHGARSSGRRSTRARRWQRPSIKTYKKAKWMLETFIFRALGSKPIGRITASELLVELKKIEMKGLHETARRTKQRCGKRCISGQARTITKGSTPNRCARCSEERHGRKAPEHDLRDHPSAGVIGRRHVSIPLPCLTGSNSPGQVHDVRPEALDSGVRSRV